METVVLFDTQELHENLLPLSFTRPVSHFRVGILTIGEKWRRRLGADRVMSLAVSYLRVKFPAPEPDAEALFINSGVMPTPALVETAGNLCAGQRLVDAEGGTLAFRGTTAAFDAGEGEQVVFDARVDRIRYVFDIFLRNGRELVADYELLTLGRVSQPLPHTCTLIGSPMTEKGYPALFIEEGASVQGAFVNVTHGPIYIGKDAEVMEGACLRGPLAVCEESHVNIGAKIYPDTTVGPCSKVGGEVNNVVIFGHSNKSHDGFLGNAVVGEWCNIGAGVNASNLKNDYSKIRIWNYATRSFMRTDLQFCGLIMGDHSKIGINVMLNTATVMGVGVNLHGSGFPRTFLPGFSEGSPAGFKEVTLKKFTQVAERVMARRNIAVEDPDRALFAEVEKQEKSHR